MAKFWFDHIHIFCSDIDETVRFYQENFGAQYHGLHTYGEGKLAAHMLPQVFKPRSPVFELSFAPEHQRALEQLLAKLPTEVFHASDSLGWDYQFWQAKRKDEVNASEVKIGARELPAVTQLFTEPYMVSFLLDNSLGAWWAARRLTEADLQNASSEEELRRLHSQYRLELSEHIEKCIRQLPNYFPGFRLETLYGERGWGVACSRDDLRVSGDRRRANDYSRLEMTVRPASTSRVLELAAKGTIRNKEVFNRNYFEQLPDVRSSLRVAVSDGLRLERGIKGLGDARRKFSRVHIG